jgi:hypothetical protein
MILRRMIYAGVICMLTFFNACGPGRSLQKQSPDQPRWIQSRPVIPGYYTGIGWARKTSNIQQYQQTAKQNALSDLAGEISVNISSSSVLHAFESNLGFREDFSSTIQARTMEQLEGFELADAWEDQGNYWIYYRLSAARYSEIKERRKNDAITRATGYLENALVSREQGNIRLHLVQLINSLETVKDYFDDPLPVEFRGKPTQLGNEIFNELSLTISRLHIIPGQQEIRIKAGQEVLPQILSFKVTSQQTGAVPDFPLLANYSERPLRNNRIRTGMDGNAGFGIDRVRSSKTFETFSVTADLETIIAEATSDPVIRRLIGRFPVPGSTVRITILKPVIMLDSKEQIMGQDIPAGTLADSFLRSAIEAGYELNNNPGSADYMVRIEANAVPAGETGAYKSLVLMGNITVRLPDGKLIYHRELEGFRGSHFDFARAGEEAYRQAVRRMNSSFFREIDEVLKGVQLQ